MSKLGYIVWLNTPALPMPEGTQEESKEIARQNYHRAIVDFYALFERLMQSGKMEGIRVNSQERFMGTMTVSGAPEKIETLKHWLMQEGLGTLSSSPFNRRKAYSP